MTGLFLSCWTKTGTALWWLASTVKPLSSVPKEPKYPLTKTCTSDKAISPLGFILFHMKFQEDINNIVFIEVLRGV